MERFNGKLRNELLSAEVLNTVAEARVLLDQWRVHYNLRPHSSLNHRPPAPDVVLVREPAPVTGPDPSGSPAQERRNIHLHFGWITQ